MFIEDFQFDSFREVKSIISKSDRCFYGFWGGQYVRDDAYNKILVYISINVFCNS